MVFAQTAELGLYACMIPFQTFAFGLLYITMAITPSQRRYLRGLAHPLKPVLLMGGKGVTPSVIAELEHALDDHELIKVKLAGEDRKERASSLAQLLDASGAENVQTIGHVAVLYRRNQEQPRIAVPR